MSLNKVIVVPQESKFRLRTRLGFPIGPRMDSGGNCPPMTDVFDTKREAERAADMWNFYLESVSKKRMASSKKRGEES